MNKPNFNIDDYPGKYAMHCNSEGKAKVFCRYMDSIGLKWRTDWSYLDCTAWGVNKEKTCYFFNCGMFGSVENYSDNLYLILEFDDFDWIPGINPSEPQLAKADTGKPRCDLVSPALIEAVGYVRAYGTDKYGSDSNWEMVETNRYVAALLRHLCAYMRDPKSKDEESGLYHLFHAACNINFLVDRLDKEKEPI